MRGAGRPKIWEYIGRGNVGSITWARMSVQGGAAALGGMYKRSLQRQHPSALRRGGRDEWMGTNGLQTVLSGKGRGLELVSGPGLL